MEQYGKILNVKVDMFVDKLPFSQPEPSVNSGTEKDDEVEIPPEEPFIEVRTVGQLLGCFPQSTGSKPKKLTIRWISMGDREAYNLETKLFSKSQNMFDTLMCANTKDDTT